MAKFYLGIDPGVGGGIAVLGADGAVVAALKMPATERDILDVFRLYSEDARAMLEFVRASPQMGSVSIFSFGRGYGALRMGLVAACVPFDEVTPQKWQAAMGCRTGGDKNISKRRAQELFPGVPITHARADALLIAEYGRRRDLGLLGTAVPVGGMRARTSLF